MTSPLPHDLAAEEAVLGRMILRPDVIGDVALTLTSSDFYAPQHGSVFAELVDAWGRGEPLDSVAVTVACKPVPGVDVAWVTRLVSEAPAAHERLVRELVGLRIRRDLLHAAEEAKVVARDLTVEPLDALEACRTTFGTVDAPAENVRDLWYLSDFIDAPQAHAPWVIPGMFREGWRVMVVAAEGRGKSWLSRQIAIAAASGIHPLQVNAAIPKVTTLLIDLENPADSITGPSDRCRRAAGDRFDRDRVFLWHRPQGIDLRSRFGRSELEGVIARCRPQFVSLGPLYKAYTVKARENDELAAGEVQHVLDDLRTRYGFALLLEHHAPKAQGGTRDLLPYGSSLWLRWPELGLKLVASDRKDVLTVGRWRADRTVNAWPDRLSYGQSWPWLGEWERPYGEVMGEVA